MTVKWGRFSPMRKELYCEHGVGHGYHIHGCCGCCSDPSFGKLYQSALRKSDKEGRKSQKHIFKEFTERKRKVHKP